MSPRLAAALLLISSLAQAAPILSSTAVMTRFDPQQHGYRFANGFQQELVFDIRTSGLCGGMVYSSLDYFTQNLPIPKQEYRPTNSSTLYKYIFSRQETSIKGNLDKWAEVGFNPGGVRNSEFFKWGLENNSRIKELRAHLDRRNPVPLGLQGANSTGNHQVLAIGYDLGRYKGDLGAFQNEFKIYVYDPNYPGEIKTLTRHPTQEYYIYAEGHGVTYQTYFVDMNYRWASDVAHAPVIPDDPVFPNDGMLRQLLVTCRTGGDDLRGGNDNLNITVHLTDGSTLAMPNVNQGAEWIRHYTQTFMVNLPSVVARDRVRGITLSTTFGGGIAGDNWDMEYCTFLARDGSPRMWTLAQTPGPFRFTGDRKSLYFATFPAPPMPVPPTPPKPHLAPAQVSVGPSTALGTVAVSWREQGRVVSEYEVENCSTASGWPGPCAVHTKVPGSQFIYVMTSEPGKVHQFKVCSTVGAERLCSAMVEGNARAPRPRPPTACPAGWTRCDDLTCKPRASQCEWVPPTGR